MEKVKAKENSNAICLINEEGVKKIATELSRNQGSFHTISSEELFLIAKYSTKKDLLKLAISEIYNFVARIIVERLNNEVVTQKEVDILLGAKNCIIRRFAVGYVTKEKVLEVAMAEEDPYVTKSIIAMLEKEEITEKEANTLLAAKSRIIREYAVSYATREKVLEMAVSEKSYNVAESIIEKLEKEEITEKEANTLLAAESYIIKNYAVEYASKEKVLEVAMAEEDPNVAGSIREKLEKEEITEKEANTLLAAKSWIIRNYAVVRYATKEEVLDVAMAEYDEDVAESIIARLAKEEITEEEANTLLAAESYIIRNYAVKYASKEKVIEVAVSEEYDEEYADVLDSIIARLEKEVITKEEADTLLDAQYWKIRNYAVEYASKEKVLEVAVSEEDGDVLESIIARLEKEVITKEEVDTLLDAQYWEIRNYAVEYASKEKVLEVAMAEYDEDVVESIIGRLIKEGMTKKELKKLVKSNNVFISNTAKILLINS